METISIAIATYNEAEALESCLKSVHSWTDEIVLVDGGSTDNTIEIAKKYGAKIIVTDNPPIFHLNKQKALDACHKTWIFQIDSDEVVTEELKKEIQATLESKQSVDGYFVPRKNFFLGHWMRKGGQYPDYVIRLFKRGKGKFPSKSVHEQIEISGKVGYLKYPLLHYSYTSINEYWKKANRYINLTAKEFERDNVSKGIASWVEYGLIKPVSIFFLLFVRHAGFVDGGYGFIYAIFSALHQPIAFVRYRNARK